MKSEFSNLKSGKPANRHHLNHRPGFMPFQMGTRHYAAHPSPAAAENASLQPSKTLKPPRRAWIPDLRTRLRTIHGLGGLVHYLIYPFAFALDWWFGTRFGACHACFLRRQWLNRLGTTLSARFKALGNCLARLIQSAYKKP